MDTLRELSELKFRVLIIGGGRWSNVYIKELLSMPYLIDIDVVSQTQTSVLKSIYGSRVINYYRSFNDILHNKKYDLAVISNQPSRRVRDISNACMVSNTLLIEKPICETLQQYIDIEKIYKYNKPWSCNWFISCPFIYSERVSKFFQDNEDPVNIYCRWNEENIDDPSYRLDRNITSTAISHFLPLLAAYLGFKYDSLVLEDDSKEDMRLTSQTSLNPTIDIAWSRHDQRTEKKIIFVKRNSVVELDLMSKELKQLGIYKLFEKFLTPLQCQVHQLLDLKDGKLTSSMRFESQNAASKIFLLNLE